MAYCRPIPVQASSGSAPAPIDGGATGAGAGAGAVMKSSATHSGNPKEASVSMALHPRFYESMELVSRMGMAVMNLYLNEKNIQEVTRMFNLI